MIAKITHSENVPGGEYFHELFVEAERIEVQFHPNQEWFEEADWTYTDRQSIPEGPSPAYIIRGWEGQENYQVGLVRGGRIFLMNDLGKTIDRYVL